MELVSIEKQLKAVADANRLKILSCLKQREICVCDFTDILHISQPAVSQHLRKLKEAHIIAERKVGTWKHYRLAEKQTALMQGILSNLPTEPSSCCSSNCCTGEE